MLGCLLWAPLNTEDRDKEIEREKIVVLYRNFLLSIHGRS